MEETKIRVQNGLSWSPRSRTKKLIAWILFKFGPQGDFAYSNVEAHSSRKRTQNPTEMECDNNKENEQYGITKESSRDVVEGPC